MSLTKDQEFLDTALARVRQARYGRAWRAIMAGLLAASMGAGTLAPSVALAYQEKPSTVSYATGAVTINNVDSNVTGFVGYRIFKANVLDDTSSSTGKSERNVAWASSEVQTAVLGVIKSVDPSFASTGAQDAAAWIEEHVNGFHTGVDDSMGRVTDASPDATKNRTWADSGTVATKLALALKDTPKVEISAGEKKSLDEGWWLFLTNDASLVAGEGKHSVGTSPVFMLVGGSDVVVNEKAKVPTVDKDIKSDATGEWGKVADSERSQTVSYRLTGTVSGNVNSFDKYWYAFHDEFTEGLTLDRTSIHVKHYANAQEAQSDPDGTNDEVGSDVSQFFTPTFDDSNVLTVRTDDLKAIKDLTGSSVIVVYYTASLNEKAVIGSTGNPNAVALEYSNNPTGTGRGETTPHKVTDYTYQLALHKVDRNTEVSLDGAKFTIKVEKGDDEASTGLYVQADGSLAKDAHEFVTADGGKISVKGLDAGTYRVSETVAPKGYDKIDDFTFTIDPTYGGDDGQQLTALDTTVTGAKGDVIAGESDGSLNDNHLDAKSNTATDVETGTVRVTVGDAKITKLPLTGEEGIGVAVGVGAAGVVISLAGAMLRRRQDDPAA